MIIPPEITALLSTDFDLDYPFITFYRCILSYFYGIYNFDIDILFIYIYFHMFIFNSIIEPFYGLYKVTFFCLLYLKPVFKILLTCLFYFYCIILIKCMYLFVYFILSLSGHLNSSHVKSTNSYFYFILYL